MRKIVYLAVVLSIQGIAQAQVVDVNGDGVVGPHEAIAVAEEWKQEAKAVNDHDHLGQTWEGGGSPFTLHGSFSEWRFSTSTQLQGDKFDIPMRIPSAPLVLENTNQAGYGLKVESDGPGLKVSADGPHLILVGSGGIIAATSEDYENLTLLSNNNVYLYLDKNRDDPHTSGFYIIGRQGYSILELSEGGDMWLRGTLTEAMLKSKIDHPLDPTNKYLTHAMVESPEMKTVYDGIAVLDEAGEAWVDLPEYFEALNADFRYQLTPIGKSAPNLFVAEKVHNNRFRIAGGTPGMEVSWQVTGIRQDAYAKANPVQVEEEKPDAEKGQSLHPNLSKEPVTQKSEISVP
jgi:hypothetical protein